MLIFYLFTYYKFIKLHILKMNKSKTKSFLNKIIIIIINPKLT